MATHNKNLCIKRGVHPFIVLRQDFGSVFFNTQKELIALTRADRQGPHRVAYDKNRKKILMTQNVCGICGKPVDVKLKPPNPLAPTVDHIIPVNKGGHPSAMENLQLAHATCNRQKSDKLFRNAEIKKPQVIGNRNLPQSRDWATYKG